MNVLLADSINDLEQQADSPHTAQKRESDARQYWEWVTDEGERKATQRIAQLPEFDGESPSFEDWHDHHHYLMIHNYLLSLKDEGYARETVAGRWQTLKSVYGLLADHYQLFEESPFEKLQSRQTYLPSPDRETTENLRPYVTREQKETLCENVGPPRFRNECIIRLMWQTGLRQGEVTELKIRDVNLEENLLEEFWRPKTKDRHTVSFGESLNWWLNEWIHGGYRSGYVCAEESDYLFVSDRAPQMQSYRPNKIIGKAADNAGIQVTKGTDMHGYERREITSHAVRRGHGMHLWREGIDLHTIRQRLGHTSIEQTQDYLPIDDEDVTEKIAGVDW
jgi:integrase/recombinase XerD